MFRDLLELRFPNAASKNAPLSMSHDKGPTDMPLIDDTIGDYFDQVAAKNPRGHTRNQSRTRSGNADNRR